MNGEDFGKRGFSKSRIHCGLRVIFIGRKQRERLMNLLVCDLRNIKPHPFAPYAFLRKKNISCPSSRFGWKKQRTKLITFSMIDVRNTRTHLCILDNLFDAQNMYCNSSAFRAKYQGEQVIVHVIGG